LERIMSERTLHTSKRRIPVRILLPRTSLIAAENLFYLAGPILGGDDWQRDACAELNRRISDATIAVPCRWSKDHPLFEWCAQIPNPSYPRRLNWEHVYMRKAASSHELPGCLIFWLPSESTDNPRRDGNPYARDTLGELGLWRGHLIYQPNLRIVIGAEEGFPGIDVIRRNFALDVPGRIEFQTTLSETITAAIEEMMKVQEEM
jgi:hypothetical protein